MTRTFSTGTSRSRCQIHKAFLEALVAHYKIQIRQNANLNLIKVNIVKLDLSVPDPGGGHRGQLPP